MTRVSRNTRSSLAGFSPQSEDEWSQAKTREGLHGVAMQEKPLTVYGVPFILLPNIMCPLKHLLQENITCSLMCLFRQNSLSQDTFHKTPSRKTPHGTTEFPKKPDIFTLGLHFHLLWPLCFQGIFIGKCLWQDSLWLTKADTLDWPVAVRKSCKAQAWVPSSSNPFSLVGVVHQRQIWVELGFLRLPACSTARRQIRVMIILLLGDFSRFFSK